MAVFFVFGAVFLAVTFLADFFGDGFDFLLAAFLAAAFAAFSSLAVNCLTRLSVSFPGAITIDREDHVGHIDALERGRARIRLY